MWSSETIILSIRKTEYPWTHQTYFNEIMFFYFFKKKFEQNEQFLNAMLKCNNIGIFINQTLSKIICSYGKLHVVNLTCMLRSRLRTCT